jgi:hypothetical protein
MARDRDDDRDDDKDDRDERPSRRRRDDDDDAPAKPGGMEGFFGNTALAIILAIVFFCICSPAGIILGGIGMGTCKQPDAKRNAMIMLILGVVGLIIGIISTVIRMGAAANANAL